MAQRINDLIFGYQLGTIGQVLHSTYHFTILIFQNSRIFQYMNGSPIPSLQHTLAVPDYTVIEQFAVPFTPTGHRIQTGVALEYFTGLAYKFVMLITGKLFKGVVDRKNNTFRIYYHQAIHHGLDHCLPVLAVLLIKGDRHSLLLRSCCGLRVAGCES